MSVLHPTVCEKHRNRWRPESQEYYGSIVPVGNSISEEYPKKCFKDWIPPRDIESRNQSACIIPAAGRPSNSYEKTPHRRKSEVWSRSTIPTPTREADTSSELFNWKCLRDKSDKTISAGLRVSRVLPYPII